MEHKISSTIGFIIIFLVIIPTAWVCYSKWLEFEEATGAEINQIVNNEDQSENSEIGVAEKRKIDAWIVENNLNEYGDPKDTVYSGGTPLFNEMTGETIDRYQYILERHPDRP